MAAERTRRAEEERKRRRLNLSSFTPNLTNRILSLEGRKVIGEDIPDEMLVSFQNGSIGDRDAYWQQHAKGTNFGIQMVQWLEGTAVQMGIATWINKQTDPHVISMLQDVGLQASRDKTQAELQDPHVIALVNVINNDLRSANTGVRITSEELLAENALARSLIFYSKYLHPTDKSGESKKRLIDTLVAMASKEANGDARATIENLQKLEPLFVVAGEEGRHALGALTVAKIHALYAKEKVASVPADTVLNEDETHAFEFLQRNREQAQAPEPAEMPQSTETTEEVFRRLTPEPNMGHTYWVSTVPEDFAARLTTEQVKSLELKRTFWMPDGSINFDVFDPGSLPSDTRFTNAQALFGHESIMFALSAVSSATPKEQAALFKALGETVLRVHKENPRLLKEFLEAQSPESRERFAESDADRSQPVLYALYKELEKKLTSAFEEKFVKKFDMNSVSAEESSFIAQLREEGIAEYTTKRADILDNFSQFPDRLVSVSLKAGQGEQSNLLIPEVDIPETVSAWRQRVIQLEEALHTEPLTLTPDQIRQIEFLGHSIDIAKTVSLMQQTGNTRRTGPDGAQESPTPSA